MRRGRGRATSNDGGGSTLRLVHAADLDQFTRGGGGTGRRAVLQSTTTTGGQLSTRLALTHIVELHLICCRDMLAVLGRLAIYMLQPAQGEPAQGAGRRRISDDDSPHDGDIWEAPPDATGFDHFSTTPSDIKLIICQFLDSRSLAALSVTSKARDDMSPLRCAKNWRNLRPFCLNQSR